MEFRTQEELARAKWADKFMSVAEGRQYTDDDSPFPKHKYFENKLLGKKVKMLEMNVGTALVEEFVADTLTDMTITVNGEQNSDAEQEIMEWFGDIDYQSDLEETARDFFAVGYGLQQVVRTVDGSENGFTVITLDPSTWYPVIPTFAHQSVSEGRVVSVFAEEEKGLKSWYAFIEEHVPGTVEYRLLQLESKYALNGKEISLGTLERFADLPESVATELDRIPVYQINRQKSSRDTFGKSLLLPVWDILQEITEIQTQIRHERIKHFKAKLAAPMQSLQRVERDRVDGPVNSKQSQSAVSNNSGLYNMNQEIFPIPPGATVIPQYIQRDLQTIEKGSAEIDRLLSRLASIVGCPRSIFNLDEKGAIHVDTEKRKDRRYVRKIIQAQNRMSGVVEDVISNWFAWQGGELPEIEVSFESPFELSREERVKLMREMNPESLLVSQKKAIETIWSDLTPEQREEIEGQIQDEVQLSSPPPNSALNNIPQLSL